jgi:molybdopterin-guanine dinucleotide biosynthesis protein MobB
MSALKKTAVVAFVGRSNSGKTTLIERLLPEIIRRGYRVGTLKHTHHNIDLGDDRKDSNRHKKAGAAMVVVASPSIVSVVKSWRNPSIMDLLDQFSGMDLVIVEGFKTKELAKIEVYYGGNDVEPLNLPEEEVMAVVSDRPDPRRVPKFGLDEVEALTDFIEKTVINSV